MSSESSVRADTRTEWLRVRSLCRLHWFGVDAAETAREGVATDRTATERAVTERVVLDRVATATTVRRGYLVTSTEHYKAAIRIYELLTSPERPTASPPAVSYVSRNIQLLLAYSSLWEAFRHLYNAACYTAFARHGADRDGIEEERTKMDRVLRPPILPEAEVERITLLRNGETPNGATQRLCSRHSREMEQLEGQSFDETITDMDAFAQGVMEGIVSIEGTVSIEDGPVSPDNTASLLRAGGWHAWVVRALDDEGRPIDPESEHNAAKYRAVVKWLCYQIRRNINFVDKTDGSLDDMILVTRAFCLLEPIVALLLQESRRDLIFAL